MQGTQLTPKNGPRKLVRASSLPGAVVMEAGEKLGSLAIREQIGLVECRGPGARRSQRDRRALNAVP